MLWNIHENDYVANNYLFPTFSIPYILLIKMYYIGYM